MDTQIPYRDPLAMTMFAAWVNVPMDKVPPEVKQFTCEATMAAWQRVGQAAVAFMDQGLAARVAELEAERDRWHEAWKTEKTNLEQTLDATDLMGQRVAIAEAEVAKLREALRNIDALDPEGMANGCSPDAIKGLVSRMGEIARATLQETKT